jgi:hypothetical protein
VDVGLVGLVLFGGEAAEAREHLRRDPDGDQLFSVSGRWAPDTASTAELSICRLLLISVSDTGVALGRHDYVAPAGLSP